MGQHAHAVAHLQGEVGRHQQLGVAALHVRDGGVHALGQCEVGHPYAFKMRFRHEHAEQVHVTAVAHHATRGALAQQQPRRLERGVVSGAKQQDVVRAEDQPRFGVAILVADAHDQDLHPTRQPRQHLLQAAPDDVGRSDGHFQGAQARSRDVELRLQHDLHDVDAQDRADESEGVRHAVAHRRIAVARRLQRRLHGRGVGARAREQAGHHGVRHVHDREFQDGDGRGGGQGDRRQQVVLPSGIPGQPGEELLAELHTEPVEEHDEAQRADQRWRLRLRSDGADEQA